MTDKFNMSVAIFHFTVFDLLCVRAQVVMEIIFDFIYYGLENQCFR